MIHDPDLEPKMDHSHYVLTSERRKENKRLEMSRFTPQHSRDIIRSVHKILEEEVRETDLPDGEGGTLNPSKKVAMVGSNQRRKIITSANPNTNPKGDIIIKRNGRWASKYEECEGSQPITL